jgi:peptidyl-prolyl cis-trans isomerase SurA
MNINPSRIAIFGLTFTLICSQVCAQTRELGSSGELLDGVAALVVDGVVLKSEVEARIAFVVQNFREQQDQLPAEQRGSLPPVSVLERQVLDQLILEQIQLQRAERLGIIIGDDQLNGVLSNLAQSAGATLEQLPAALAGQGIDYNEFREQQRQELTITQLERRDVINRIGISPRELELCLVRADENQTSEFDYSVSHILIGFTPTARPGEIAIAEERINEIRADLDAGADFAQLALSYSESQTALEGGALGWRKGSELPTIFTDFVMSMSVGDVSDPIRTGSGFHLVRLNDLRGVERVLVDQVLSRHILITPNEILDDDATVQKMIGIRNQIIGGDEFGPVASAVSEDAVSAAAGGELGWSESDAYVPEFTAKLESLELGVVSAPFRSQFGWHILEVMDRRAYDMTDDLKSERCQSEIGNGKVDEERDLWTRRIRDEAFIERRL